MFLKIFTLMILYTKFDVIRGEDIINNVFDWDLYETVLDPELCQKQLEHIVSNPYILDQFLDAGIRIPRGILLSNFVDLGNYFQCLEISESFPGNKIEGKYCKIYIPINQLFKYATEVPELQNTSTGANYSFIMTPNTQNNIFKPHLDSVTNVWSKSRVPLDIRMWSVTLGVCLPKACTTRGAIDYFYNFTAAGLQYMEQICRLPNDKPWTSADYAAVILFITLGILTLLGTIYDARHSGKDPKQCNAIFKCFSFYANLQRLTTFKPKSDFLECLDGIRVCAMIWVILGHTCSSYAFGRIFPANALDAFLYMISANALWISTATISVDSFLVLSGLLTVYLTRGRLTSMMLLKNIHIFYLNRVLRMFPILATAVLLQASVFHRVADGPYWDVTSVDVNKCRTNWWHTLLYIQNMFDPQEMCLFHTWYLAVDVQLHILSPLVLFWVLSKRRHAWTALVISLVITIIGAAIYNFIMEFPSAFYTPTRLFEMNDYFKYYYFNTFTRASPLFIGMGCGYILSIYRKRTINIPKVLVFSMWLSTLAIAAAIIYSMYPVLQMDWDNQLADSVINSFSRPLWALCLSWWIFACVHGYGGIMNSFLSHGLWKLPSRLSYGMYLFHYPVISLINGTAMVPWYFSVPLALFRFSGILSITTGLAFIATVLVDAPFSELVRLMLKKYAKRKEETTSDDMSIEKNIFKEVK